MRKFITASSAALVLAGTTLASTPADAQRWYGRGYGWGGYHRGGGGVAVGAGLLGLAAGAAIASSARPYYGPAYGYGYYAPPPPPAYGYGYGYGRVYCRGAWRWDGYIGRYVRVRYCD